MVMKVIHLVYNYTWRSHETGHLLQGIKSLASLGVPVYVTETGIPDRTGKKREEFFKTYPAQVLCISSPPLPSPPPLVCTSSIVPNVMLCSRCVIPFCRVNMFRGQRVVS